MKSSDTVSILIPVKAEYVSIARLTASGIASRVGFDIDTIEDIKIALSEVLGKIIEKETLADRVIIDFICQSDGIDVNIGIQDNYIPDLFDNEDDKFAFDIIRSLMDDIQIVNQGQVIVTMVKKLGKAV